MHGVTTPVRLAGSSAAPGNYSSISFSWARIAEKQRSENGSFVNSGIGMKEPQEPHDRLGRRA